MNKKYYSLEQVGTEANINIYGDITSWALEEYGEMSAVNLSRKLEELDGVSKINVYINSYGGEVAEGLAIYNSLKRHPAEVVTYCDGFACSIASVIFMAGDKRVMNEASLLMIHNAWASWISGNAAELRKQAEDLDTITSASVAAYMSKVKISEEEVRALMDAETWLSPADALEYGFATVIQGGEESDKPSQNARKKVMMMLLNPYQELEEKKDEEEEPKCAFPDDDEQDDMDPDDTDDMNDPDEPDDMEDGPDDMDDPDDEEEPKAEFPDDEEDPEKDPEEEPKEKTCGDDERKKQCAFFRAVAKL